MLSRQRGTDSLNVLEEGARGAPAASDVSIIPGGIETRISYGAKREREVRCRAIDRPGDHAHPGETRALMFQVKIERRPGQTRREDGSAAPSRLLCVLTSCTYLYPLTDTTLNSNFSRLTCGHSSWPGRHLHCSALTCLLNRPRS